MDTKSLKIALWIINNGDQFSKRIVIRYILAQKKVDVFKRNVEMYETEMRYIEDSISNIPLERQEVCFPLFRHLCDALNETRENFNKAKITLQYAENEYKKIEQAFEKLIEKLI